MTKPRPRLRRAALVTARTLALAYVLFLGLLFAIQRRMIYPGAGAPARHTDGALPDWIEPLWLDVSFGRVEAWLISAGGPPRRPAIVFAHGNGETIDTWDTTMRDLARRGVHVLLVEFPGYGHSDGRPTRATLSEAFRAARNRLAARRDVDATRIVAWGRSLGGGAAADLAMDGGVRALVLQSTFSSLERLAWENFRAPGFLVRDRWDNVAAVTNFAGPVLLMHGPRDDVIPFSHAGRIAAAASGLEPLEIDCAHNDCAPAWPEIRDRVIAFLEEEGILDASH